MTERILIADDEKLIRWSLRKNLLSAGYEVLEAEDGQQALEMVEDEGADLLLLDIRMPHKTGLEVLAHMAEHNPEIPVVLMTAFSSVEGAVDAMKRGAFDYLMKPFNHDEVLLVVQKALHATRLQRELALLQQQHQIEFGTEDFVGKSEKMREVCRLINKIAASTATTVLVLGESGTGKDLAAKAIHYSSNRADQPFVNITCSALPEQLLESELMGHEKGSFTGARERKRGLFEVADGGTIFLDEIGDMAAGLQAKLLRILEEKSFRRVGGTKDLQVDVRIVAATNRNLEQAVREGAFREDLYYRLMVIPVDIPPLRERLEDIPLLITHFIDRFNVEFRKKTLGLTSDAMECCEQYGWPGNVRELRNVVERAMILENKEFLDLEDLPHALRAPFESFDGSGSTGRTGTAAFELPDGGYGLREMEQQMVRQALEKTEGNQSRAAELLDISRDSLRYKMRKFGMF
ncbi:MAG: sigma-54-dependent Fis family transcriptional regulator [Deltaproteobacteria bacterium]|nr:sigma-54-dependent Fis family transcriptional regulator [Deltaproteobacteria bacterium]MBW2578446.1 sigma-54-dependent Fis family transcriptional regulator [Deltaproteobacteria bacterium]MBW2691406.1 sigma-54-dependent Fis family transcriptional regulator [Deltaproteobacteria bacterium]